jgi:RNA polymerase sigma factor (sigma-70 family)
MPNPPLGSVLRQLRRLVGGAEGVESPDGQLLEQFATTRDERAFEELLARHGPMVYSVCRRVLDNDHDAADAYQATFLVLARKAGSIRKRGSVGSWLYGVAYRVARKSRTRGDRLLTLEEPVNPMCDADPTTPAVWNDLRGVLDDELNRLPAKYRDPLVLCYLEGQTHEQAAKSLGWPSGTMSRRVGRGLEWLRERLVRRGVTMPSAALAAALAGSSAQAVTPVGLSAATARAAVLFAQHAAIGNAASASVLALADGMLHSLQFARLKFFGLAVFALGLLSTAGVVYHSHASTPTLEKASGFSEADLDARLQALQPTPAERRIDEIGWARDVREGLRLANEHNRPLFLFNHEGQIGTGRCGGSAFNMRAHTLADTRVIALLNRAFVPVSSVNDGHRGAGGQPDDERRERTRIVHEALNAKMDSGDDCIYVIAPDGKVVDGIRIRLAKNADALIERLEQNLQKLATATGPAIVAPHPLSVAPAAPDALVLHLVARVANRQAWCEFPAEDWIVLPRERADLLLGLAPTQVGESWLIDPTLSAGLLTHFYPQTENNNLATNRLDRQSLRAMVISVDRDRVRARLDGELRMKHRFYPSREDDSFVDATLVGLLEYDARTRHVRSLRLITETATYGEHAFTAGLTSLP